MNYRNCVKLVTLLLCLTLTGRAFAAAIPSRITSAVDDNQLVRLARNTRPEANRANDRGPVYDGFAVDHMFLLLQRSPQQEQKLDKLIDSLNDKKSPNFHHWLTADEFGARFGVAQEDIDNVTSWLRSNGFHVNQVYPNRVLIDFSGTAGSIRQAFHTEIHQLDVGGEMHFANMSDPQIPEALAPVVKAVASLNDFKPHPMYKLKSQYTIAGCGDSSFPTEPGGDCYFITPLDNAAIYNLNPLWSAGISGQGQTIALVEDTDTYGTAGSNGASDWNTYRSTFGLNSYSGTYTQLHPGGCTDPGTNADDGEAAIDVEVAAAIAPSAAIELISCPSTTFTFGGQIALQNMINAAGPYPGVVSVSYGECEALNGTGGNAAFYNTYQQAAAQGISVFVSAGDEGPSSCSNAFSAGSQYDVASLGVTGWGETPYNVSVGGTDFEDTYNVKEAGASFSTYWSGITTVASFTGGVTSGSTTVTAPSGTFVSGDVGLIISGTDIPFGATITAVASSTSATMSGSATGTDATDSITLTTQSSAPYGSALSYIPEIPWNDACASVLISEVVTGSFVTYGASPAICNNTSWDTSSTYLSTGAGSGGASNCATGAGGTTQTSQADTLPTCQGWSKPAWQSAYGVPSDGVRDIPDVSMFAANGVWGHYEVVCWSDPAYTADGSASCAGTPGSWAGFGGTSVASPTMAAIQALVNQKTGETWGNPNPIYYQIAQGEYGTQGGTFLGSSCNSSASGGPASGCVFNDVTQGDIDLACEDNGTTSESHCYKPTGTHGVDSTDNITAASVINGGTGYTAAPTCTIAGPTNNSPYLAPTGATLWAGGTQASCTAAVNSGSTNAVWSVVISGTPAAGWAGAGITVGGSTYTFVTTLTGSTPNEVLLVTSGTSTAKKTDTAENLRAAINNTSSQCFASPCFLNVSAANANATATESTNTVTLTAKAAAYAGNFNVTWSTGSIGLADYISIANTTLGQGPNYVSGITITTAGSGYQPDTPITLTGGGGTGAIAVANTSVGTAASTYQPAYGAAPGYDLATGLGTPNAYNLVNACAWLTATPGISSPAASSTLTGSSVTFTWNPSCNATAYWIDIGSAAGANNYYSSGNLGLTYSANVSGLPTDGSTIYVTLYDLVNGSWTANPYTFTAFNPAVGAAVINLPQNGSPLTGGTVAFAWTSDSSATAYWLDIGSSAGANNYYTSGNTLGLSTSKTVSGLPTNGSIVYATLYSLVGGIWTPTSTSYTAFNAAAAAGVMSSPTNNSTLAGSTQVFTWTLGSGSAAWLDIGSSAGANNYYTSGNLGNTTTETVYNLPTDGTTVYATLYTLVAGSWIPNSYTYTAFNPSSATGVLTSPAGGSTLTSGTVTFSWSPGTGASGYWLDIGSTPGANNYYTSGNSLNTAPPYSVIVYNLPTDGSTIYATFYTLIDGQWYGNSYTYYAINASSGLAAMTTPNPLTGSTVTFNWSSDPNATNYWVDISAVAPGGNDLDSSGPLGLVLTETVYNMPGGGAPVYVTLYSYVGGQWLSTSSTYTSN